MRFDLDDERAGHELAAMMHRAVGHLTDADLDALLTSGRSPRHRLRLLSIASTVVVLLAVGFGAVELGAGHGGSDQRPPATGAPPATAPVSASASPSASPSASASASASTAAPVTARTIDGSTLVTITRDSRSTTMQLDGSKVLDTDTDGTRSLVNYYPDGSMDILDVDDSTRTWKRESDTIRNADGSSAGAAGYTLSRQLALESIADEYVEPTTTGKGITRMGTKMVAGKELDAYKFERVVEYVDPLKRTCLAYVVGSSVKFEPAICQDDFGVKVNGGGVKPADPPMPGDWDEQLYDPSTKLLVRDTFFFEDGSSGGTTTYSYASGGGDALEIDRFIAALGPGYSEQSDPPDPGADSKPTD